MDGVQGYSEDQTALAVPDLLNFVERITIILGTPTIGHIINVMKEREIDALVMPWVNARVAHLLSVWRAAVTAVDDQTTVESSLDEYDEVVITKNTETVDAFSSHVIHVKAEKAYTRECINIMTQALQTKESSLPQGLTIQNEYTELRKCSKDAVVVVRKSMVYPQTLKNITLMARAVATSAVLELPEEAQLLEGEISPKALTHLNWLLDRDKGSYLKS